MTGAVINQASKFSHSTEYAHTLMARDYKGAGNQIFNVVIEVKDENK